LGNGDWSEGRDAYVDAHYGGEDLFVGAETRFDFYKAELEAAAAAGPGGLVGGVVDGLLGGLLGGFVPGLCAPETPAEAERRLMVVAGIDCTSVTVDGTISAPPVQTYLEVFVLGPGNGGLLNVEVTACLGGDCGGGNLGTEVHDVVRLVE